MQVHSLPLEVLSLVPTFLSSQKDRFHAASVCRRWRRTFLQCGPIWSQLFTTKGDAYLKTLLDRAKTSALDVVVGYHTSEYEGSLLATKACQIRRLEFEDTHWDDIADFSQAISRSLPLLNTLKVAPNYYHGDLPETHPRLFQGADNLERLVFHSGSLPGRLRLFAFPCLSTFELRIEDPFDFTPSDLLDFLGHSPMLRRVKVEIFKPGQDIVQRPGWKVVDLPNLETISLSVTWSPLLYKLAAHISCPRVRSAFLNHVELGWNETAMGLELFPDREFWDAIAGYYAGSTVEEVKVEVYLSGLHEVSALLTFLSSDGTAIGLGFDFPEYAWRDGLYCPDPGMASFFMTLRALKATRNCPRLTVQRLHIKQCCVDISPPSDTSALSKEFTRFFNNFGPLERLTLQGTDVQLFNSPDGQEETVKLPDTQELVVSDLRVRRTGKLSCHVALLVQSQQRRDNPFTGVAICGPIPPGDMVELASIVNPVVFRHELLCERVWGSFPVQRCSDRWPKFRYKPV